MEFFKEKILLIDTRNLLITIAAAVTAVLMFIGFRFLYQAPTSEYMKEVVAGCIGAVLTIAATAALIKSQSDNELRREQSVEVFKAKLVAYTEFVEFIHKVIRDGKITKSEQSQLVDWGLRLSLIAGDDVIWTLCQFLNQSVYIKKLYFEDLTEEEVIRWKNFHRELYDEEPLEIDGEYPTAFVSVGRLIQELRFDLGESKIVANDKRNLMMGSYIDSLATSRGLTGFVIEESAKNGIQ